MLSPWPGGTAARGKIVSPIGLSLMAFAAIVGGVLIGVFLRSTLPGHHLADDAKDVVRLGTGRIATIAALVLSLLIHSAKTSFDSQNGQVQHMTADIILLDHLLAQYGPETHDARDLLRRAIGPLVDRIWRKNGSAREGSAFCGNGGCGGCERQDRRACTANRYATLTESAGGPGRHRPDSDPPVAVRTVRQVDPRTVPGGDGVLAGDHLHEFQSFFSPQPDRDCGPVRLCLIGIRGDLPDPGNEPTVYRADADFQRPAAQRARSPWRRSHIQPNVRVWPRHANRACRERWERVDPGKVTPNRK